MNDRLAFFQHLIFKIRESAYFGWFRLLTVLSLQEAGVGGLVEGDRFNLRGLQVRTLWRPLGPSFVDAHKFSRSFIFGDCRPILETFRDLSDAFIANRDK